MEKIERFFATVERRAVDRPAFWFGLPVNEAQPALFKHFRTENLKGLYEKVDDDLYPIEFPYHSPDGDAIYSAFAWKKAEKQDEEHRTLGGDGFFAAYSDPSDVDKFPWPDPALYINPEECLETAKNALPGRANLGMMWSCHFQDACAAFGMENAFVALYEKPVLFKAVIDHIVDFYLKANRIFYEATKGHLHAVLLGNDFGCQTSLMVSRTQITEFALPGTRKLIEQAHSYGLKVIHHSCGAIREIIPDIIAAGADVIHPIQALATGMGAAGLKLDFVSKVSFCGGLDVQELLVNGTAAEIRAKVLELRQIFPTGLIVSPSHEAILPDVKMESLDAMIKAACEFK